MGGGAVFSPGPKKRKISKSVSLNYHLKKKKNLNHPSPCNLKYIVKDLDPTKTTDQRALRHFIEFSSHLGRQSLTYLCIVSRLNFSLRRRGAEGVGEGNYWDSM